jgi:hypothetical protein
MWYALREKSALDAFGVTGSPYCYLCIVSYATYVSG